jgi:hypothetical protein
VAHPFLKPIDLVHLRGAVTGNYFGWRRWIDERIVHTSFPRRAVVVVQTDLRALNDGQLDFEIEGLDYWGFIGLDTVVDTSIAVPFVVGREWAAVLGQRRPMRRTQDHCQRTDAAGTQHDFLLPNVVERQKEYLGV